MEGLVSWQDCFKLVLDILDWLLTDGMDFMDGTHTGAQLREDFVSDLRRPGRRGYRQ